MRLSLIVLTLMISGNLYAKGKSKLGFTVEPIVGYEREVKLVPTVHTAERLFYGGRMIAGYRLFSLEVEYTRASDTEEFPSETINDQSDKLKVGLRSTPSIGKVLFFTLRAGVQASRVSHEVITGGVSTVTEQPLEYDPYAGGGIRLMLSKTVAASLDFVGVFTDASGTSTFAPQASAGISIGFP